ncbi:MAG: DEAD/DEAH box helicase [Ignavibacteriae bacterium]|nr:DEAD/DEAH box helicase [Ignavibacteriota bacterium]
MHTTDNSFYGLGIAPGLLNSISKLGFTTPTPIQHKAIPIAIEGKDIIGIAQTGTGKTLAFGIPMLQRLAAKKGSGLILVPTRELALQVRDALAPLLPPLGLGAVVLIGGEAAGPQIGALRKKPRIVIATPGRLLDLAGQGYVRLNDVAVLILDEADRMLDMGFAPQIEQILQVLPSDRQTMLFSATMPGPIVKIASTHMRLPVRTEIAPTGTAAEGVSQEVFVVAKDNKGPLLERLLEQYTGSVLLFTRTKRGAKRVAQALRRAGHSAAEIHSDRTQAQRKHALDGFKSGKYRILCATDIAARGIDVYNIELVVNYDLPEDPDSYVHRIGRTARAGRTGHAISLATPDQRSGLRDIEKLINMSLELSEHPDIPAERFDTSSARRSSRPQPQRPQRSQRPQWGSEQPSPARARSSAPTSYSSSRPAPAKGKPSYRKNDNEAGPARTRTSTATSYGSGGAAPVKSKPSYSKSGSGDSETGTSRHGSTQSSSTYTHRGSSSFSKDERTRNKKKGTGYPKAGGSHTGRGSR